MWVVHLLESVIAPVNAKLELGDRVTVARHTEYAFRSLPSKGKDSVRKEGKNDRNFLVGVIAFLEADDRVQRFSEC